MNDKIKFTKGIGLWIFTREKKKKNQRKESHLRQSQKREISSGKQGQVSAYKIEERKREKEKKYAYVRPN